MKIEIEDKYELHIASPRTDQNLTDRIIFEFKKAGFKKIKFFLNVYDVPNNKQYGHCKLTPPTGHDLRDPELMISIKSCNFKEIKNYLRIGMKILKKNNLEGNFEVEKEISDLLKDSKFDVSKALFEFLEVDRSPLYENHIIWKNKMCNLPSNDNICKVIEEKFKITPHQIIDFCEDNEGKSLVSRVATIYQANRENTLKFASKLKSNEKLLGHKYMVAEQVCLVGK